MKINPVSQSDTIKQMSVGSTSSSASKLTVEISDSLELSEGAQKFSELIKNAKKSMEASGTEEEEIVSNVIARMSNNTYKVSDKDIVNNILGGIPTHI